MAATSLAFGPAAELRAGPAWPAVRAQVLGRTSLDLCRALSGSESGTRLGRRRSCGCSCQLAVAVVAGFGATGTAASRQRTRLAAAASKKPSAKDSGLGVMAGVLHSLRVADAAARSEMLSKENNEGLKAISVALRLKGTGTPAKLARGILEALAQEEAMCTPGSSLSRIIEGISQMPERARAVKWLIQTYKADMLKSLCQQMRLARSGKKEDLAERISQEAEELWRAQAARAGSSPAPQAASDAAQADTSSGAPAEREVDSASDVAAQQIHSAPDAVVQQEDSDPEVASRKASRKARSNHVSESESAFYFLDDKARRPARRARPREVQQLFDAAAEGDQPPVEEDQQHIGRAPDSATALPSEGQQAEADSEHYAAQFGQATQRFEESYGEASPASAPQVGHPDSSGYERYTQQPTQLDQNASQAWQQASQQPEYTYSTSQTQQWQQADAEPSHTYAEAPQAQADPYTTAQAQEPPADHDYSYSMPESPQEVQQPIYETPQEQPVEYDGAEAPLEARRSDAAQTDVVETKAIESKEEALIDKRQRRFVERRMKLVGYLAEEVATAYGAGAQDRYISDMRSMLEGASDGAREAYLNDKLEEPSQAMVTQRVPSVLGPSCEAPEFGAWHSEPVLEEMTMVGELGPARMAWCKWWDRTSGCGELVDLDDQSPVAVVSAALTTGANVSPRLKYLRNGEFVEYRRVERGVGQTARALLVRGLRGWPLMCEVDGGRALPA